MIQNYLNTKKLQMNRLKNGLLLTLIGLIVSLPVQSKAGQVQDVIDHFLAAASTQLPDTGMASLLSAAPSAIKSSQMKKCEVNMQDIILELGTYPPADRVAELEDDLDRNQAVFNALNGNPDSLNRYTEFKKKREKERRLKRQKEEKKEQEDSLEWQFSHYRSKIEALKSRIDRLNREEKENLESINSNIEYFRFTKYQLQSWEALITALVDKGKQLCTERRKQLEKIVALRDEIQGGESLVEARIGAALEKTGECKSNTDDAAVKQAFASAKQGLSIMKQALDGIKEARVEQSILKKKLDKINEDLKRNHAGDTWAIKRDEYQSKLEQTKPILAWLNNLPAKVNALDDDRKKLKQKLEDARKHYEPVFPESKKTFKNLKGELNALNLPEPVEPQTLYELEGKLIEAEKTGFVRRGQRPDIYSGPPPVIRCAEKEASRNDYEAADESFFRALIAVKANEVLADGCQKKEPEVQEPDTTEDTPDAGAEQDTNEIEDSNDPGAEADAQKEIYGGLRIAGPATMYVDKQVAFTAVDAAGMPYPADSGGFVWQTTMESLMTISPSGNPTGASAFKPGPCSILVKYKGMSAWLDVIIKPKKAGTEDSDSADDENLFSFEGGETVSGEDSGGKDSLFSMEGGETVAEIKTEDSSSGEGISLLGENPGQGQKMPAPEKNKQKTNIFKIDKIVLADPHGSPFNNSYENNNLVRIKEYYPKSSYIQSRGYYNKSTNAFIYAVTTIQNRFIIGETFALEDGSTYDMGYYYDNNGVTGIADHMYTRKDKTVILRIGYDRKGNINNFEDHRLSGDNIEILPDILIKTLQ